MFSLSLTVLFFLVSFFLLLKRCLLFFLTLGISPISIVDMEKSKFYRVIESISPSNIFMYSFIKCWR